MPSPIQISDRADFNGGQPVSQTNPLPVMVVGASAGGSGSAVGAAQDGTDATGVAPPAGGVGIRGWLSGIYAKLTGTLRVDGSGVTQPVVVGNASLAVTGTAPIGSAPVNSPVSIAGVDASGNKQHVRTDTFGTPADIAWTSGNGSMVALGKALVAAQQATTAAVTGTSLVPPSPGFTASTALGASLVLKASAGSLYMAYVTTGATGGWLLLIDATTAPAGGATVAPRHAIQVPANSTTQVEYPFLTPEPFANGVVALFSTTGPFTFTPSATAFFKGVVQ